MTRAKLFVLASAAGSGTTGHHLRGRLVFPADADGRPVLGPGAKSFELRLHGAQGEPQAVFPWSIVRR